MLTNMSAALRTNGIGALYSGYLAFILKSLPYDVAELVTYSELSRLQGPLQRIPQGCRDVLSGQPLHADHVLSQHLPFYRQSSACQAAQAPSRLCIDRGCFMPTTLGMMFPRTLYLN